MTKQERNAVLSIAEKYGFDAFDRIDDWNGYEVYSPYNKDGKIRFIGQPVFILVRQGRARVANEQEWEQIIAMSPDD